MSEQNENSGGFLNQLAESVSGALDQFSAFAQKMGGMDKMMAMVGDYQKLSADPNFQTLTEKIAQNPTLADAIASVTGVDVAAVSTGQFDLVSTLTRLDGMEAETIAQLQTFMSEVNNDPTVLETLNNVPVEKLTNMVQNARVLMEDESLIKLKDMVAKDPDMKNLVESVAGMDLSAADMDPKSMINIFRRGPDETVEQAVQRIDDLNQKLEMAADPNSRRMINFGVQVMEKHPQLGGALMTMMGSFSGFNADNLDQVFAGGQFDFSKLGLDFGKIMEGLSQLMSAFSSMFSNALGNSEGISALLSDGMGMVQDSFKGAITGEPVAAGNVDLLDKAFGLVGIDNPFPKDEPAPSALQPNQDPNPRGPGAAPALEMVGGPG